MSELNQYYKKNILEAGCDEAGRGCLAGPVYAAAVILPENYKNQKLNDSKKLNKKTRNELRVQIENDAIAYSVAFCNQTEIDQINILNASILAMHKAISNLKTKPQHLIIDGNRFKKYQNLPHKCIVKGDSKYLSIAAASVLAKTYRDEFMEKIHAEFPYYQWNKNMGYPTKKHREAIKLYGSCIYHRKSFKLLSTQLKLNL